MPDSTGFTPDPSDETTDSTSSRRDKRGYDEIFVDGYNLWRKGQFTDAIRHFETLIPVWNRGAAAHVLLAHCHAMLGHFGACTSTLSRVFSSDPNRTAASQLHEAFVMWKCGLYVDAKADLEKVIREHAELPTPCLILADLMMRSGNRKKSIHLLHLAIERDRVNGAVATIARYKLAHISRM